MSIERLKSMKECFMTAVEGQMYNLAEVDAEELGEVVDMIKDLSEAVYYCSITEAMDKAEKEKKEHGHNGESEQMYYPMMDRMYYRGQPRDSNGRYTSYNNGSSQYSEGGGNGSSGGGGNNGGSSGNSSSSSSSGGGNGSYYTEKEFPYAFQDPREGRSPRSRRMYMESKETRQDKKMQMRELEKYMQELAQDIIEMVKDASQEEKQYLSEKISALAIKLNKISPNDQD